MAKEHNRLVEDLNRRYPDGINLPPEYADAIQNNTLSLLIRLARYKFILRLLKKSDRVLEIGCSTGVGTIFLGQHCRSVVGIDRNKKDIEFARQINKRKNVSFEDIDFFKLHSNRRYDAVVSLDVIEHFNRRQGEKLAVESLKFIKRDGIFIVGTPSVFIRDRQNAFSKAAHVKMYTQEELLEMVQKYYRRAIAFSMNDELVHTGNPKVAWYYFVVAFMPRSRRCKK